jgi:hypothetical protein
MKIQSSQHSIELDCFKMDLRRKCAQNFLLKMSRSYDLIVRGSKFSNQARAGVQIA